MSDEDVPVDVTVDRDLRKIRERVDRDLESFSGARASAAR